MYSKTGNRECATCFAKMLQIDLSSNVACFTTYVYTSLCGRCSKGKRKGILGVQIPYPFHLERLPHRLVWTCLATNKVARFFFVDGKMPNIPIQLILQQIHKTSCTFFVACFTIPLSRKLNHFVSTGQLYQSNGKENLGLSSQISFFPK